MSLQLDLGEQPIRTEVIASTRKRPIGMIGLFDFFKAETDEFQST